MFSDQFSIPGQGAATSNGFDIFANAALPVQPSVPSTKPRGAEIVLRLETHGVRLQNVEENSLNARERLTTLENDHLTHRNGILHNNNLITQIFARITQLERQVAELKQSVAVDASASEVESNGTGSEIEEVQAYTKASSFKEVIRTAYQMRLGVPNLTPQVLPAWPGPNQPAPIDPATNEPLLRLNWAQKWNTSDNFQGILTVTRYIIQKGPALVAGSATALAMLGETEIEAHVVKKYQAMQKALRGIRRFTGNGSSAEPVGNAGEGEVAEGKVEDGAKPMTGAYLVSRAKGKLQVRQRKREALPRDSVYHDAKYDAAFTENLMSDDEDEMNEHGERTGRYVSYAPLYRSTEITALLDAIDAVRDPAPSKRFVVRIKAKQHRDDPPKVAKLAKNKARRWMIDPEWLRKPENKQYDTESRILENGKAWGDDEDPEVREESRKRFREEKKEIASAKRTRQADFQDTKAARKAATKTKANRKKKSGKGKGKGRDTGGTDGATRAVENTYAGRYGQVAGAFAEFIQGSSSGTHVPEADASSDGLDYSDM